MPTIRAGDLDIAYTAKGPLDGPPVLLIHGWPDDASTWDIVAAELQAEGFRTIVPSLRGFSQTQFVAQTTPRTGNSAMLAIDMMALMDALAIENFVVAGHDWGSNTAEAMAVGWPERIRKLAMLSTPPRLGGMPTSPFWHAQLQWYHWFMATKRGAAAVREDRRGFAHRHWVNWAPSGWFDEDTFNRVAEAWENPDWVEVTIHSYRARWGEAEPDPQSVWLERLVETTTALSLPTVYIHGEKDGVNPPESAQVVPGKFNGPFEIIEMLGVGHFPQREAPASVAEHLQRFFLDVA